MGTPNNLVVLIGTVSHEPTTRTLPSGVDVVQFDLSTQIGDHAISVPVAWHDPRPNAVAAATPSTELLVIGTVRRRFFRVGGSTQSRTEVIVDSLVPTRRTKSVRSALAAIAESLSPESGWPDRSAASV